MPEIPCLNRHKKYGLQKNSGLDLYLCGHYASEMEHKRQYFKNNQVLVSKPGATLKRFILYTLYIFFLTSLLSGCSTQKNTAVTRAYHNVTARYNVYFNGKESFKAGVAKIDKNVEDDFTRILPVYRESYASAGSAARPDMENAILKASKLVQNHSITKKPKRQKFRTRKYKEFASQEEFNQWIDDSYLLMGKSYYYEHNFASAVENFSYVLRKFPQEKIRYDAMVWLIRSYSELERFPEAMELIEALQSDKSFPNHLEKELAVATADMYLKQKDYQEAAKFLDISIKKTFWKKEKARYQYILAQLYQETGDHAKASAAFRKVRRYNPPYKMDFNARINAAGMFSGEGDPEKLKKDLRKMLRDEKNLEFRDQIYFALANIFYKQGENELAIENYRKSVSSSVDNNYQRALSSVTLADIFFKGQKYKEAQMYYDSALMVINEEYPNYQKLNDRFNSLTRLVENLTVVEVQDSLQKLAAMPEAERNALINTWIAAQKEKQRQQELIAAREQTERGYYRANEYRFGLGTSDQSSGWYFYNPQTISYGKAQFQQRWGRRKLEDDWRRSNKNVVSSLEADQFSELADSTKAVVREDDPLEIKYYTQDIPFGDSLMALSHEKIRDGLYNAGKIFKSDFSDYPRSVGSFEDLNTRYPENIYLLSSWFDLYDDFELMGNHDKSQFYRNLIISRFPNSKYARYLQNPNFFAELEAQQDSLNRVYQNAFRDYKAGRYSAIIPQVTKMKRLEPDTILVSKIDFMNTVALGVGSDMQNFETLLKKFIADYPKSTPTPLAKEILTLIQDSTLTDYQKLVEKGYLHDEIRNNEIETDNKQTNDEFGGKFSYDEDLLHYFVICYPKKEGIEINRLKFDIGVYNLDHYTKIDFDIEEENLDANNNLLLVRSLQTKEQGLIYFRAIIRQPEVFKTLKDVNYFNFIISSANYRQILAEKSIADYLKFFLKNYSRFIGPDFKPGEGPEESPEELMLQAQRENEMLKEKGKFVAVDIPVAEDEFVSKIDTVQNFVLGVKDKNLSMRSILMQFADFNRNQYKTWNLTIQTKQSGDYQFIIVKGLPGYLESMSYFRKVVMERSLFRDLGQLTYRNFVITEANLERILKKGDIDSYLNFFRANYIQKAGQPSGQSGEKLPPPVNTVINNDLQDTVQVRYSGPYRVPAENAHCFVLIVPLQGYNKAEVLSELKKFNDSGFKELNLTISEKQLDDVRNIIRVDGLGISVQAMDYLRRLVGNRAIFAPLGDASYRNFIATPANYEIFLQRKNITEYLDFYKQVYLKNR
jgi:tetratricopeptide (TPR) repeat protein